MTYSGPWEKPLQARELTKPVSTVLTQVEVDPADPAFQHPTKPIGSFMTREEAEALAAQGFAVMEDAGRGYRRVVASPRPKAIVELETVRAPSWRPGRWWWPAAAAASPYPVQRTAASMGQKPSLTRILPPSFWLSPWMQTCSSSSPPWEQVAIHFRQPDEAWLSELTPEEAESYIAAGEFAPGSMLPKGGGRRPLRPLRPGPDRPHHRAAKKPGPASPEKPARGCGKRNPTWQPYAGKQESSCFPAYGCPF